MMKQDIAVSQTLLRARSHGMGQIVRQVAGRMVLHSVLIVGALIMTIPFIWMIRTSFMNLAQVFKFPPQWIPNPWVWTNYPEAISRTPFARWFWNSLRIAGAVTIGQAFTCSLAGFTFARLRFPGNRALFLVYLGTMMIPGHVTIIPVFVIMNRLNWVNTSLPLVIPGLVSAWGTFMFRQFFLGLPGELMDAAKIDGCSYFRVYSQIFLPLAKPALATQAVFTFMSAWNDFLGPIIFLQNKDLKTLTVGLLQFRADYQGLGQWHILMAGVVMSIMPILIAFIIGQEYFVKGIALSGIKG